MLTDSDVLASLSKALSPGELSSNLRKLLRVPAAWRFLHRPEILSRVIDLGAVEYLQPSRLAALAVGATDGNLTSQPLTEDLEEKLEKVLDSLPARNQADFGFLEISLLGVDLLRQDCEVVSERLHTSAHVWAQPFAVVWPCLDAPHACLSALVADGNPQTLKAACSAAQANVDTSEAAELFASTLELEPARIIPHLLQIGEVDLARNLASAIEDATTEDSTPDLAFERYKQGLKHLTSASLPEARQAFESAWESSNQLSARIADSLGDIARLESDHVFEVEATGQALEAHPTASRRARHARALMNLGRLDEAQKRLPEMDHSPFENIVQAQLFARSGDQKKARETAKEAACRLFADDAADLSWVPDLLGCIERLGLASDVLEVAQAWVQRDPVSVSSNVHLSHALAQAGHAQKAVDRARLALSLEPGNRQARTALARHLQRAGDAESAMPLWMSLAGEDPLHQPDLIRCALEAGELEIGLEQAEDLQAKDPGSSAALVLLASAKIAAGDTDTAIGLLESVISSDDPCEDAWILLASYRREDQEEAYAATLAAGIQTVPSSARLHYVYAKHLYEQRVHTEAMEHFQKAVNLDPEVAEYNGAYGSLLFELGHVTRALPYLEEASLREPGNWSTKSKLARAYAQNDQLEAAAELLADLPEGSGYDQHLLAGELLTKASREIDSKFASPALNQLKLVDPEKAAEPALDLWISQALEQAGDHEAAFDSYQSFLHQESHAGSEHHLEAILGQARTAIALDQASMAVSLLEQVRPENEDSSKFLLLLADAYRKENLLQQAVDCARKAVEAAPDDSEPLRELAEIEEARKAWKSAAEITERWAKLEPTNIDAWILYADRAQKAGSEQSFRDALAKALWLGRSTPAAVVRIAKRLHRHGVLPSAKRIIRRAMTGSGNVPVSTLEKIASVASDLEDHATASSAWLGITRQAPDDPQALAGAAQAFWLAGNKEKAIEYWQIAVRQDTNDADLRIRLAEAMIQTGEVQQGLELFGDAATLEPESASYALHAGRAFAKYGTTEEALGYLRTAVELNPSCVEMRMELARLLFREGRVDEAGAIIERCLSEADPSAALLALAAMVSLELERFPEAEGYLQRAEGIRDQSSMEKKLLAEAQMRFGRWQKALTTYQEALAEDWEPATALDYTKAMLRMLDANWLYAGYAHAYAHAPNSVLQQGYIQDEVTKTILELEKRSLGEDEIHLFKQWVGLHDPEERISAVEAFDAEGTMPLEGELAHAYAIAQLSMAQPARAIQHLENASVFNPDAWGALLVGVARSMQGNPAEARRAYKLAQRNPIIRPLALRLEGRAWEAEGERGRAIERTGEALGSWPDEPAWHYELGTLYMSEGALDAALPHLQHAVELAPSEMDYLITLGRLLRRSGQVAEAEGAYARAIQKRPDNGQIWKEAAQVSLAVGKIEQAEEWFERAQILAPSDAQCVIGAARAALEKGDKEKARGLSRKAAHLAPDDVEVLLGIGEIHTRQGKFDQALKAYDKALSLSDDPLTVQLARAKVLTQVGRPGQAVSDIRLSLDRAPEDARLWAALAEACEADGDLDYAAEAAAKSLRIAPRNPAYHLLYGRLARKSGQLDIALDELTQARASLPQNPAVYYELGRVYEERRQHARALEAFQESLRWDGVNAKALFHTGLILKQLKAYQDAGQMFERAVEINPRDPDALHQLAAVRALQLVHGGLQQTRVNT